MKFYNAKVIRTSTMLFAKNYLPTNVQKYIIQKTINMKTENLKIAIFPIGSAMKFRKENIKRADGTSEYFKLFYGLVRNPNVSEVWLLQRSDWKKLSTE